MGCVLSRKKTIPFEDSKDLREKIRLLEVEIRDTRCKREKESRAYERQLRAFATKEVGWRREKKRWRDEVGKLKKMVEEKEEMIRRLEEEMAMGEEGDKEWQITGFLFEHMREEWERREEAVEKWKRLYLAIKTELDDLILRTDRGERLYLGTKQDEVMEGLRRELKGKEEMVEELRAKLESMQKEGVKREREIDILRQSLRIMSNAKGTNVMKKSLSRSSHRVKPAKGRKKVV